MQISAGKNHFAVLKHDGTAVCEGQNKFLQLYVPLNPDASQIKFIKVLAGDSVTIGIKSGGEYLYWGAIDDQGEWGDFKDIAMSTNAVILLKDDNSIVEVSGSSNYIMAPLINRYGEPHIIDRISAAERYAIGLTSTGQIVWWGDYTEILEQRIDEAVDEEEDEVLVQPLGTFIDISAGKNHVLALDTNRHVKGWGDNTHFQLDIPRNPDGTEIKFMSVSAGWYYSIGITENGEILSWGKTPYDEEEIKCIVSFVPIKSSNKR